MLRLAGGGDHFFGDLQHLGKQLFALLTTGNISSQMHNQAAVAAGFFKCQGGNVHPEPFAGACLDLEVKIGSFQVLRSALLNTAAPVQTCVPIPPWPSRTSWQIRFSTSADEYPKSRSAAWFH